MPGIAAALLLAVVAMVGAGTVHACDMMGYSFNKEVEAHQVFDRFRELSPRNRDGWGVGFYTDASPTVFKEPIPVAESRLADTLIANRTIRSKLFILHLRAASIGKPSHRNTHPWVREVGGTEYTLAHVGGADKRLWQKVELGRFQPVGENCAEYMFCHIVGEIEKLGITAWGREAFDRLHRIAQTVNEVQTTSHLLSEGTHLFAYSSTRSSWLAYARREMPPAGAAADAEPAVGFVVARNGHNLAQPGEPWTKISPGHLVVFKDGEVVYRSDASKETEP
ncbi:MAG: class II glutamine amidotransferase [Thermoguttaceae bacterium]